MSSKSIFQAPLDRTSEATIATDAIHFEVGSPSPSITINVIGDRIEELNETITVTLSSSIVPLASLEASITTTTVIDDEIYEILSLIQLI